MEPCACVDLSQMESWIKQCRFLSAFLPSSSGTSQGLWFSLESHLLTQGLLPAPPKFGRLSSAWEPQAALGGSDCILVTNSCCPFQGTVGSADDQGSILLPTRGPKPARAELWGTHWLRQDTQWDPNKCPISTAPKPGYKYKEER